MQKQYVLTLLLSIFSCIVYAQDEIAPPVNIGDAAPPLHVQEWLKGMPIDKFEKGKVYVVEFWATWCKPCIAAMPHLSALARKYRNEVTFIGIDVSYHLESMNTPLQEVKKFVAKMGNDMDFTVAAEDSNFMERDWIFSTGTEGIPRTYVINADGKLAWIGHPKDLASVLYKILNNEWNIIDALSTRKTNKYLKYLDDSLSIRLNKYRDDMNLPDAKNEPDSALIAIGKWVQDEPMLKYAYFIGWNTFIALLQTNMLKAYEYGKTAIATQNDNNPTYEPIIDGVQYPPKNVTLTPEIYVLGAEAYQLKIKNVVYPKLIRLYKYYQQMAEWYSLGNDKRKAVRSQRKVIKLFKKSDDFSRKELHEFRHQLKQYRRNKLHKK